jgi:EAL domain-containing protein (putative c-di-GMP-specific phosphodiesterase class I)
MPLSTEVERTHRTRDLVEQLINDPRRLGPDYEPIVALADQSLVAVKSTGRGTPGTDLADTLALLDGARSLGLVERLDWAFRALAFDDMAARPDLELHITPEPETFGTPARRGSRAQWRVAAASCRSPPSCTRTPSAMASRSIAG